MTNRPHAQEYLKYKANNALWANIPKAPKAKLGPGILMVNEYVTKNSAPLLGRVFNQV